MTYNCSLCKVVMQTVSDSINGVVVTEGTRIPYSIMELCTCIMVEATIRTFVGSLNRVLARCEVVALSIIEESI